MKVIKTAEGNQVKMSKSEWEEIGKTAGWIKEAESVAWNRMLESIERFYQTIQSLAKAGITNLEMPDNIHMRSMEIISKIEQEVKDVKLRVRVNYNAAMEEIRRDREEMGSL